VVSVASPLWSSLSLEEGPGIVDLEHITQSVENRFRKRLPFTASEAIRGGDADSAARSLRQFISRHLTFGQQIGNAKAHTRT